MKKKILHDSCTRFAPDAGIAIGPILFIIAILGILAAAIAAGSGSFTVKTSKESDATKASALIDLGSTSKLGMDRLMAAGYDFSTIYIDIAKTTETNSVFSPTGGGVGVPSTAMASCPTFSAALPTCALRTTADGWNFPKSTGDIMLLGTTSGTNISVIQLMMIPVTQGTCDAINQQANALVGSTQASGVIFAATDTGNIASTAAGAITAWDADLKSKYVGCINSSSDSTTPGAATDGGAASGGVGAGVAEPDGTGVKIYYFFQVIGVS
jgi:hypothetical protein